MKIAIVNTSDCEGGGAAKATLRLHQALNLNGINSKMLVLNKKTDYKNIIETKYKFDELVISDLKRIQNRILLETIYRGWEGFSNGKIGINIFNNEIIKHADIIHLNWINRNFINISSLKYINKPIVWTLHDMWPFTGGCHHARDCTNYQEKCGKCPRLKSNRNYDLSTSIFNTKINVYNDKMVIVGCSKWITECAKRSKLFRNNKVITIPNTLDTNIFKPISKKLAKSFFRIDSNKFVILFGAYNIENKRKGFKYFRQALKEILQKELINNLEILIFGSNEGTILDFGGADFKYIGKLNDEYSLSLAYNASDIFVTTTLEDNLPNTIMESLSCGTPVISFDIGGVSDLVNHKVNGYLAEYKNVEDLINGIYWVYKSSYNQLRQNARNKVIVNYNNNIIARKYIDLYESLLQKT